MSRVYIAAFSAIAALLVLTACGGNDTGGEPTAPPPTAALQDTEAVAPTEAPEATIPPTTVEEQPSPTGEAAEPTEAPESELPDDVPVMENAVDLNVQAEVGSVTYVMEDTEIEDVVDFYETRMAELGWESRTSSAIGLMATLVFEKDEARVSVSLQANNIARTVTVRLFILEE